MSSIRSTPHDSRVFFPSIASERFLADCSFHLSGWNTFRPFPKSIPGVPHSICVFYLEYLASTLEYFCTRHAAFHHFFVTYGHFFFNSSLSIHPLPLAAIFVSPRIFHPSLLSDVHYPISCVLFQVTSYHFQNASLSLNSFLCPTSTHLIHCPSTSLQPIPGEIFPFPKSFPIPEAFQCPEFVPRVRQASERLRSMVHTSLPRHFHPSSVSDLSSNSNLCPASSPSVFHL